MIRQPSRHMDKARTFWVVAALCLVGMAAVPSARALDIRVQGKASLQLEARAAGTRLTASGQLVDDLGKPLPQRGIEVVLFDDSGRETRSWMRTTDRHGRFRVETDVEPGSYRWVATFASTRHVEGTTGTARATARSLPIELSMRAPDVVRIDGDTPIPLTVEARVDSSGLDVPVSMTVGGRPVGRVELGSDGRGQLDISSYLSPGVVEVNAEVPPGEFRESARTSAEIRAVRGLSVEASLKSVITRLQRGVEVSGRVVDQAGPVGGIDIFIKFVKTGGADRDRTARESSKPSTGPPRRLQTDASGRFSAFVDRDELSPGSWRARVQVRPDVGDSSAAETAALEVESGYSGNVFTFAAGLAVLALLAVMGREAWGPVTRWIEKRRTKRQRETARRQAFSREEEVEVTSLDDDDGRTSAEPGVSGIGGVVWDIWRDEPVESATVTLEQAVDDEPASRQVKTDASGRFEMADIDSGEWTLRLDAPGFVEAKGTVRFPHGGEYSGARFDLLAVPLKIRRMYQVLVEDAGGRDMWGSLSPREIEAAVRSALSAGDDTSVDSSTRDRRLRRRLETWLSTGSDDLESSAEYLQALTDIVEETYYSDRSYREDTWRLAREIALKLRDRIDEGDDR